MRSSRPKVLYRLAGFPLIEHVLRAAGALTPETTGVVVGHLSDQVRAGLAEQASLGFVLQTEQLGTGHALLQAEPLFRGRQGSLVVLSGDVPLIRSETLRRLVATHERAGAAITVVTATVTRPYGYGRTIRKGGRLSRVVEERDASEPQRALKEINSGIYAFDLAPLFDAVRGDSSGRCGQRSLSARARDDLPTAGIAGRDDHGREPERGSRDQQPDRTGGGQTDRETEQERGADGGRRHHRGPGNDLCRHGRHRRSRHGDPSGRHHRGTHDNRCPVRAACGGADRRFHPRGRRAHQQPLCHSGLHHRAGRPGRTLRPPPSGDRGREEGAAWELRRDEEDVAG